MSALRLPALAVVFVCVAFAQEPGVIPRWQVEELAVGVVRNVETASKIVDALRPKEWIQDGAPQAYIAQHKNLQDEMEQIKLAVQALGRNPEKLSYAVDTFLWLDRADALFASISAGARRYYNSAVADLLDSARNRNTDSIATMKLYIRQLAIHVEQSMDVAHREAQRCRSEIISRPPQP